MGVGMVWYEVWYGMVIMGVDMVLNGGLNGVWVDMVSNLVWYEGWYGMVIMGIDMVWYRGLNGVWDDMVSALVWYGMGEVWYGIGVGMVRELVWYERWYGNYG